MFGLGDFSRRALIIGPDSFLHNNSFLSGFSLHITDSIGNPYKYKEIYTDESLISTYIQIILLTSYLAWNTKFWKYVPFHFLLSMLQAF